MKELIRSRLKDLSSVFSVDDWRKHCIHLLEDNDHKHKRIEQLEKALEMAMPIVEHNSPTLTRIINHTLGKEE